MDTAEHIKTKTIEWLLSGHLSFDKTKDCLAAEVLFSKNRRKADLLLISKELHTLEIKSNLDDVRKLKEQLTDYQKTFDKVTVVTTEKHISRVSKLLGINTGLVLLEGDHFKIIRKAKKNNRLNKFHLLMFLNKNDLCKLFDIKQNRLLSTDELRFKIARNTSLKTIRIAAHKSLHKSYHNLFRAFLRDIGKNIMWDEVRGLSGKTGKLCY